MTRELAARIQGCHDAYHLSSMTASQQEPGNPYRIRIERFGTATACLSEVVRWEEVNRIVGIETVSDPQLDDLLALFRDLQIQCHFDMEPGILTKDLARRLMERGFYPSQCLTVLYGVPRAIATPVPPEVRIDEEGPEETAFWLEVLADVWEFKEEAERENVRNRWKGRCFLPGYRNYIAYWEDTPAAVASLYLYQSIGKLSLGATAPAYQKRGCHTALIHRRLEAAAKAGCDLVMVETGVGSTSQHNMERAGLRIAYTMSTWIDGRYKR